MSPLLCILLTCLSMHACNARCLGFMIDKEARKEVFNKGLVQDVDNEAMNLNETLIPSDMMPSFSEELGAQEQKEVVSHDESTYKSLLAGASTMKHSDLVLGFLKEKESSKRATSGNNVIVSSQNDLLQEAKIEGLERQGRSILGSTSHVAEEAVESKEKETVEDIVVTDYAQPHRKPPIHNEKP